MTGEGDHPAGDAEGAVGDVDGPDIDADGSDGSDGSDDAGGAWVGLFSGGKDSAWALHLALERGLDVRRLLTVHPAGDSYLYHTPATRLTALAAESIGIPLVEVEPADFEAGSPGADAHDSGVRGDAELEPLEAALRELQPELPLAGVTAGAVESEYQTGRLEGMCRRLGVDLFAPLWRRDPATLAREMLDGGLEVMIIQVAARGLDESWLGRRLDGTALDDLRALHDAYGVHVLGEGGEFETLVTDGPHMSRPIQLEYETEWEGTRGRIRVTDAWLGEG